MTEGTCSCYIEREFVDIKGYVFALLKYAIRYVFVEPEAIRDTEPCALMCFLHVRTGSSRTGTSEDVGISKIPIGRPTASDPNTNKQPFVSSGIRRARPARTSDVLPF